MTFIFHFYILLSGMVVIKIILCYDIMWFYRLTDQTQFRGGISDVTFVFYKMEECLCMPR